MDKIYLILLLLVVKANSVFSYEIALQKFDVNPQLHFEGTIGDNYDITMYLNLYGDSKAYGKYKYDRIGRYLVLFGKLNYPKLFQIHEYDKNDNTGIFDGRIYQDKIRGTWTNNKTNEKLPFRLHLTHGAFDNSYLPRNIFLIKENNRNYAFIDLSKEIMNSIYFYKLYFSSEKNENHYLIFLTEGFSRGGCVSGMCGCGIETHLVWTALNSRFDITDKKVVCLHSCLNSIEVCSGKDIEEFFKSDKSKLHLTGFDFRKKSSFVIDFDKAHPEKGPEIKETNDLKTEDLSRASEETKIKNVTEWSKQYNTVR
ncbi:MAG: hypothetical protein GY795_48555 [Desulfobacterales bacterium]|nr:hypothetical protein [Desulfobacterales bacterium]